MKILVLSDSHAALSFMRLCIEKVKPDWIVHLGDYFDDGQAMAEEYPEICLVQVPGNCDKYRCPPFRPEILIQRVGDVQLYMTHGHKHRVKVDTGKLLSDARASRVDAVLYGHTHVANCYRDTDGLWILNPGSCGYFGGSAGLIETKDGKILGCRILRQEDLEDGL
ncbi:MAG: metallophosphoesterase [Oscillospiraceae bacterium]|nr:metallophosphoesterase [Oscillospiraceae bacterium]